MKRFLLLINLRLLKIIPFIKEFKVLKLNVDIEII